MTIDEINILLDSISGDLDKLNDWERKFFNNIDSLVKTGRSLTDKQCSCLEKIYRKSKGG
jgi:hypothetical protein